MTRFRGGPGPVKACARAWVCACERGCWCVPKEVRRDDLAHHAVARSRRHAAASTLSARRCAYAASSRTMIGHAVGPGVPDTAAATAARLPSPSHEQHSEPKS